MAQLIDVKRSKVFVLLLSRFNVFVKFFSNARYRLRGSASSVLTATDLVSGK